MKTKNTLNRIASICLAITLGVGTTSLAIANNPSGDGGNWIGIACFNELGTVARTTEDCCLAKCKDWWSGEALGTCVDACKNKVGLLLDPPDPTPPSGGGS